MNINFFIFIIFLLSLTKIISAQEYQKIMLNKDLKGKIYIFLILS